jgi:hypothetical protein
MPNSGNLKANSGNLTANTDHKHMPNSGNLTATDRVKLDTFLMWRRIHGMFAKM